MLNKLCSHKNKNIVIELLPASGVPLALMSRGWLCGRARVCMERLLLYQAAAAYVEINAACFDEPRLSVCSHRFLDTHYVNKVLHGQ
jgi:hypothetical protein